MPLRARSVMGALIRLRISSKSRHVDSGIHEGRANDEGAAFGVAFVFVFIEDEDEEEEFAFGS